MCGGFVVVVVVTTTVSNVLTVTTQHITAQKCTIQIDAKVTMNTQ